MSIDRTSQTVRGTLTSEGLSVRTGIASEKDLDEVVQIENVFLNVSKGQVAPQEDLQKAFGTTEREKITLEVSTKRS